MTLISYRLSLMTSKTNDSKLQNPSTDLNWINYLVSREFLCLSSFKRIFHFIQNLSWSENYYIKQFLSATRLNEISFEKSKYFIYQNGVHFYARTRSLATFNRDIPTSLLSASQPVELLEQIPIYVRPENSACDSCRSVALKASS